MRSIRTILCPVDFTSVSECEIELAAELAGRFQASLLLQHNLTAGSGLGVDWMHAGAHLAEDLQHERDARRRLAAALDSLPAPVRAGARGALTYGSLDHCVHELAVQSCADLIVIGSHGRGDGMQPSQSERLVFEAPCPVLTLHEDAPQDLLPSGCDDVRLHTLVPIDFQPHSMEALFYALDLATVLPLNLTALYVSTWAQNDRGWALRQLAAALPNLEEGMLTLNVAYGPAVEEILLSEDFLGARMVIMGTHVHGFLERILARGRATATEVLHRSPCPVWFVPQGTGSQPARDASLKAAR